MSDNTVQNLSGRMDEVLRLASPPLAIRFRDQVPDGIPAFDEPMPTPTPDGRTGRVPAGCVFWMKAAERSFSTVAADHGNCSVGSMTHGFKGLDEVAGNSDVAALLESGWVSMEVVPQIPVVSQRFQHVVYGPLAEADEIPDVVFLRVNGKQAMIIKDAWPAVQFEGKPQCHIVAIAKEQSKVAISTGCMLSRVRTGMGNQEMTCAIPGERLADFVDGLESGCGADMAVAKYAAEDASRFDS